MMLTLVIGLQSTDREGLLAVLGEVSHPASPKYGQHLSKAEVARFVAPTSQGQAAVASWLASHNITPVATSPSRESWRIRVPVGAANALLNAEYTEFVHKPSNSTTVRTLSYALPEVVEDYVRFIYPTTQFHSPMRRHGPVFEVAASPKTRRTEVTSDVPPSCAHKITPSCLQALYHIPASPATAAGNEIAVSAFGSEVANKTDLRLFLREERPDIWNATFGEEAIDAGNLVGVGTSEANLDTQYTVGIASRVPTRFVSVGWQNDDEIFGFMDIIDHLLQEDSPPPVLTTSYGFDETEWEGQHDAEVVRRVCHQDTAVGSDHERYRSLCDAYAQLGARGTTVIFSSGDGGVAGGSFDPDPHCDSGSFVPGFPSTCPFVTSVGATEGINPERAAPYSSGGFSNIFPRPAWQDSAVRAYLGAVKADPAYGELDGRFNASGRAFPDVAVQGTGYAVYVAGKAGLARGTSASAPVFASMIGLLNDERLREGKSMLGWVNPLFYYAAEEEGRHGGLRVLNDVSDGRNPGCGTRGFPAVEGWDAVTGLGTPDYEKLRNLVMGY
ncbi:subtilisin-like protein [Lentinus brumalis]|uniref:Subtilisin-like protein n=1 Tax=Lentinus brumalis TaxID=2498619 RepID=A0A371CWK6_9APHY|nr:subtilisin-like protein [Polyporus brumalis]